jgi:hypothetical protein
MGVPGYPQSSRQIRPAVLFEVDEHREPAQVDLVSEKNVVLKWGVVPKHWGNRAFQAETKFLHEPLLRHAQSQG